MWLNPITLMLFSRALNAYIAKDAQAPRHLKPLCGKILCLDLRGTGKRLYFLFYENTLVVEPSLNEKPHATLVASPATLMRVFFSKKNKIGHENLHIEGQVQCVHDMQRFFSSLDVDLEEQLALLIGDTLAHHTVIASQKITHLCKDITRTTAINTVEFLQEEAHVLPTPEGIHHFCESVDALSLQTERLATRLAYIKKKYG